MAKIRETAENFLRDRSNDRPLRIYRAVVTVPAHFKNAQKYATKEAARQAGFTDVFLITEPGAGNITLNILSEMFILRIEGRNQLFFSISYQKNILKNYSTILYTIILTSIICSGRKRPSTSKCPAN